MSGQWTKGALASGATISKAYLDNLENGIALGVMPFNRADVRNYGAKGDGSTDDQTAIKAAIAAVAARTSSYGAGEVFFPAGVYACASKLTIPKNIKLVGEGAGGTVLLYTGGTATSSSDYFLTFGASGTINTNGGVERLQVDANLKLGWALLMYGPQEGSVLWLSLIRGGKVGGLDCRSQGIEGGNNKFLIASCWIWADGSGAMYGAKFDDANGPFAIRDSTFVRTGGGAAPAGSAGLYFNGGYQSASNVNCEQWESHTNLDAWSNFHADTLSTYGCTYGITRRVTSGADPAVRMDVENLTFDGATAYIRDLQQGITIATCKRWSNREIDSSAWNGSHLTIGTQHLWVDSSGRLRIKSSQPTSDTDGTIVGTQL